MSTISISYEKAARFASRQTTCRLQELIYSLKDNVEHHREAAAKVNDPIVRAIFTDLANERQEILESIGGIMTLAEKTPDKSGSLIGKIKTRWTSLRAILNGGDETVVLIEAERAEDALLEHFRAVLPEIASSPIIFKLHESFDKIKAGHDQIFAMRA